MNSLINLWFGSCPTARINIIKQTTKGVLLEFCFKIIEFTGIGKKNLAVVLNESEKTIPCGRKLKSRSSTTRGEHLLKISARYELGN